MLTSKIKNPNLKLQEHLKIYKCHDLTKMKLNKS